MFKAKALRVINSLNADMSHEEHEWIIDGRQVNEGFSLSKPPSLLYHVLLYTGSQTL